MEIGTVSVFKSKPSTAFTAHNHQIVTPPPSNPIDMASYAEVDVDNDPFPWGGRFGRPDFNFAGLVPPTRTFTPAGPQFHEMDFYGSPSTPHGPKMKGDAETFPWGRHIHASPCDEVNMEDDPFPWGGRFGQPDLDFAALVNPSNTRDSHGHSKDMQASGALYAPRPVRPRARLCSTGLAFEMYDTST
jgi:hypothetical protein